MNRLLDTLSVYWVIPSFFVVGAIVGLEACKPNYGAAVAPAALTAHAVIDCVEACEDAPNLAAAIVEKIECTPKVIEAARAWCASGVVEGPFCAALPGKE